jgi:uncharacterized RDD family membrane protein YckC
VTEHERERAIAMQGRRAGFVSRSASGAIVVAAAIALYFAIVVAWGFIEFLATNEKFKIPHPDQSVSATVVPLLVAILLAFAWSTSGRSVGDGAMGLRVVTVRGERLGLVRALVRAIVLVTFAVPCMLWILVSRKNAGLHDLLCKTTVVYDWKPRRSATPFEREPTGALPASKSRQNQ